MAYLLLAPDQAVGEERKCGLVAVWTHPHQACLPSLDEVARKLALLINTGEDWSYTFMQLNEDSQHIPLSNCWAYQHHDRQCIQQEHLWVSQSSGGPEAPAVLG